MRRQIPPESLSDLADNLAVVCGLPEIDQYATAYGTEGYKIVVSGNEHQFQKEDPVNPWEVDDWYFEVRSKLGKGINPVAVAGVVVGEIKHRAEVAKANKFLRTSDMHRYYRRGSEPMWRDVSSEVERNTRKISGALVEDFLINTNEASDEAVNAAQAIECWLPKKVQKKLGSFISKRTLDLKVTS